MKTNRYFRRVAAFCICAAFFCTAYFFTCSRLIYKASAAGTELQKQIHSLESKLSSLNKDAAKLKSDIAKANSNIAGLEKEIENLESETTLLTQQITTMDTLIEQWTLLTEEKQAEISALEKQQAKEQKVFDNMLRMSYEYGSDTYFNLIFGSESIGDFLSRVDLITYHLKYNNNVMENLATTKKKLETTLEEYNHSTESLAQYKTEQEELKTELEVKITQAEQKNEQLRNDAAKSQALYSQKEAELNSIGAEIKVLYQQQERERREAEAKGIPYYGGSAASGTFMYPLPANYTYVSSGFVNRISPITGKRENHNGLDLPAPLGTHIYAADGGTVVIARRSSSWGDYITIDHGNGLMTLYAHCSALNVTAGQTVIKGDVIGYVGSTGWSTGNHLHFTVYKNGVAVNPAPYICM